MTLAALPLLAILFDLFLQERKHGNRDLSLRGRRVDRGRSRGALLRGRCGGEALGK